MRVIVTEKGQDLRKELFFEKINSQASIQLVDDKSVNQGATSNRKKTNRGLSLGSEKDHLMNPNFYQENDMNTMQKTAQKFKTIDPQFKKSIQSQYSSQQRAQTQHPDMIEMQIHIPKIKISKYFKAKYQGAYIPPSQIKEMNNRKGGLVFSQSEKQLDKTQMNKIQQFKYEMQQKTMNSTESQLFPAISSMKQLHIPRKEEKQLKEIQHEPVLIKKNAEQFQENYKLWSGQLSTAFSREHLLSPSFNKNLHKLPFGYLSSTRSSTNLQRRQNFASTLQNFTSQLTAGQTLATYNFRATGQSQAKNTELNNSKTDSLIEDEEEQERMRKDKIKWKHHQDEAKRAKMMIRLREKLEVPESAPELYDPRRVQEERDFIENAIKRSVQGEGSKDKVEKEHNLKYKKYWDKDHAASLSNIRKYDLSYARFKDLNKNPQNILVFNGKLLDYLQKTNNGKKQTNDTTRNEKNNTQKDQL
ncbi:UNKNOWN [Stylonychia lemnae]|uniref:Uncharacterized protein n=1 Tax=Stylonychia lemnae TaxID=5949 RepID=A0A078BAV4_STYLE|nr:UNKNOWN [Stylonychia lemnae]|eukprot:CDW91695.1 UNKNOWN [Stylonychia lemnae]